MAQRGKFIVFEGLEGVGKSTALKSLHKYLAAERDVEFLLTREPGGTKLAEDLRSLLKDPNLEERVDSRTELLLMYAARVQLVTNVIEPHLAKGGWVICDRFFYSTFAYQGGGREMNMEEIEALNKICLGDLRPDLVVYLDLDPEVGLQRARQRAELDRFELEKIDFFHRIRKSYLKMAEDFDEMSLIDASQSIEAVAQDVCAIAAKKVL